MDEAERQLVRNFNLFCKGMSDLVFLMAVEGDHFRYLSANSKAMEVTGFKADAFGKRIVDVMPPDRAAFITEQYRRAVANGGPVRYEDSLDEADAEFVGESILTPILDDAGEVTHILAVTRNITRRRKREAHALDSLGLLESFFNSTLEGIVILDETGRVLRVNEGFRQMFGWTQAELTGRPVAASAFIPAALRRDTEQAYLRLLLHGGKIDPHETQRISSAGLAVDVSASYSAITNAEGETVGITAVYRDCTEKKRLERKCEENERKYESLFKHNASAVFSLDLAGHFTSGNAAVETITGYAMEQLQGKSFVPLITPASLDAVMENFELALQGEAQRYECEVYHKDGHIIALSVTSVPIIVDHTVVGVYGIAVDLTEWKRAEEALRRSEEKYRLIADNMNDLVCTWDMDGIIRYASPSVQSVLGYPPAFYEGRRAWTCAHPDDLPHIHQQFTDIEASRQTGSIEYRCAHKELGWVWLECKVTPVLDDRDTVNHFLAVSRDITERKQFEAKLTEMAYHDTLTGLPNRRFFAEHLQMSMASAARERKGTGLIYLDCDKFKLINDTLGHDAGDALLRGIAERLARCVRETDKVVRLGGDEFAVVLSSIEGEAEAEQVAARILESLQKPWKIGAKSFVATSSIGVAVLHGADATAAALIKQADVALYQAKASGRNRYKLFRHKPRRSGGKGLQ